MTGPTGRLASILEKLDAPTRKAVLDHLRGGTSANWLSKVLARHGHKISPTTLKEQRALLKEKA